MSQLGALAEWLRSGLQSRLHRFDSGRRLWLWRAACGLPEQFSADSAPRPASGQVRLNPVTWVAQGGTRVARTSQVGADSDPSRPYWRAHDWLNAGSRREAPRLTPASISRKAGYRANAPDLPGCFAFADTWTSFRSPCRRAWRSTSPIGRARRPIACRDWDHDGSSSHRRARREGTGGRPATAGCQPRHIESNSCRLCEDWPRGRPMARQESRCQ
jgi:hypothetical protein